MKLISLRLKNFRQHRDSRIHFQDGMTAIVGANGSGKTTVIEAITFALFGEQRDKKETVRYLWAGEGEKFAVELIFTFDGRRYRVARDETTAIFQDVTKQVPVERAKGLTAVSAESRRLLRLTYQQFINSFCAEQKKLKFLEFEKSTRLQEEVARMLGYDRIGKAASKGREQERDEKIKAETIASSIGNPETLLAEIYQAKTQVKEHEDALVKLRKQLEELIAGEKTAKAQRTKAESYLAILAEQAEVAAKAEGLKEAEKLAQVAIDQARAEVEEHAKLQGSAHDYEQAKVKLAGLESEREAEREREILAARLKDLQNRIDEGQKALDGTPEPDLAEALRRVGSALVALTSANQAFAESEKAWNLERTQAQDQLSNLRAEHKNLARTIEKAERTASQGICPECGQAIGQDYLEVIAEKKATLAELEAKVKQAEVTFESKSQPSESLKKAINERDEAAAAHKDAQTAHELAKQAHEQRVKQREALTREQSERDRLASEIAKRPSKFDRKAYEALIETMKSLEPSHKRYLQLDGAPARLRDATARHGVAAKNLTDARTQFEALKLKLAETGFGSRAEAELAVAAHVQTERDTQTCQAEVQRVGQTLESAKTALATAETRHAEYQSRKAEFDRAVSEQRHLKATAQQLDAFRERLNREIGPDLEARASENLSALTDGRYPKLTLDQNFQATISDGHLPKHVISGGEEDVLALSLRLALSELIQERNGMPLSLLILDEVFGGLDEDRRSNVLERLMALKGRFHQILVISHIEEINQVADQCIYVTRDVDQRSSIVTDVQIDEEAPKIAVVQLQESLFAES